MKKVLAGLTALIMALCCVPITANASAENVFGRYFSTGIEKPKKPYIHIVDDPAWQEIHIYFDTNNDIRWFGEDFRRLGEEAFIADNGLYDIYATVQTDYKVDNGEWRHNLNWDNGTIDNIPNYGLHQADQSPSIETFENKMLSFKVSDAVAYNFDDPNSNGDFINCVSRSGAYPDFTNYRYDLVNHTYAYRYRYLLTAVDESETRRITSPWSDEVSIGKNATQQNLTKNTNPAALTIIGDSHLNVGTEQEPLNGFWLDFSIPQSIYDDLKYYEIVENMFEPLAFEVQYRINGGTWKEGGVANATWLDVDKAFGGTDTPLKKGDKVEFRARIAEGADKSIKGPWSNIYTIEAPVTDYNYTAPAPVPEAPKPLPAISSLSGTPQETQVTKFITELKNDNDPKGTVFYKFPAKQKKVGKNYVTLSWSKVKGAKYYIVYGNKCGAKNRYKYIKKVTSTSFTQKGLKKGTYYKYLISAFDSKGKHIATSPTVHVVTAGGKYCNFKKVTTKAKKNQVVLAKKGKTFKLGAKAVKENAKMKANVHRAVRYESTNKKVATVDSKGKITAKKKGTCYVWAYAQNGASVKIKVTVKK